VQTEIDVAGHLFGIAASGLNYFQVLGALGFALIVLLQVRRWWDY
jgi:hypothetical protein